MMSFPRSAGSSIGLFTLTRSRRTIHKLGRDSTLKNELVTTRMILLLDAENEKLWDLVERCLEEKCGDGGLSTDTRERLRGFGSANGTVLFYEDQKAISTLQSNLNLAKYATHFKSWSDQTNGMHQYVVWTALCAEGLGATLQHYNPLIDEKVGEAWGIDQNWTLIAQLVFGKPEGTPKKKAYLPMNERLIVRSAE